MARDYKNKKYGKLLLVARVGPGGAGKGAVWLAQCDCGNMTQIVAKEAARGKVKSCGKCKKKHDLTDEIPEPIGPRNASERRWFSKYVRKAFREGKEWTVTYEELREISEKSCTLCDSYIVPSSLSLILWDPQGSYALGNVISICSRCNEYSIGHNLAEFLEHTGKITDTVRSYLNSK